MPEKQVPKTARSDDSSLINEAEYTGLLSLEECILWAISSREMYGLEIVRAIDDVTDGQRQVSVGALYPALQRLEQRRSLVSRMGDPKTESRGGARRKYFRITENGLRQLARSRRMREELVQWQPQSGAEGSLACSLIVPLKQELAFVLDQVAAIESRLQSLLSIVSNAEPKGYISGSRNRTM